MRDRADAASVKHETGCFRWLYGWKIYLRDRMGNVSRRDVPGRGVTYQEAKAFLRSELAYGDYEIADLVMKTAQDT